MTNRRNSTEDRTSAEIRLFSWLFGALAAVVASPLVYEASKGVFIAAVTPHYPPQMVLVLDWVWYLACFPVVAVPSATLIRVGLTILVMGGGYRLMNSGFSLPAF